jgi:prepilin signal peptidase PulO-like enzyme (type II secretory pathway)
VLATLVDTKALAQSVVASAIAGVGVTTMFAVLVFSVTRSANLLRDDRTALATAAGVLATFAFLAVIGAIVLGIVVMIKK